jgi:hypothetical protein
VESGGRSPDQGRADLTGEQMVVMLAEFTAEANRCCNDATNRQGMIR